VILYVEMGLQMRQNSSQSKFCVYLLICFNVIHVIKDQEHHDNNVNDNENSFKTTLYILSSFCVEMSKWYKTSINK
jgi:hypothetical protein